MDIQNLHFVLGFVNDKDLDTILPLFPKSGKYYFTKALIPRALNEQELGAKAGEAAETYAGHLPDSVSPESADQGGAYTRTALALAGLAAGGYLASKLRGWL